MAKVALPPPKGNVNPVFKTISRGSTLFRIYNPEPHGTGPTTFRHFGPLERFDHQPDSPKGATEHHTRGILYAAFQIAPAICEVFGEDRQIVYGTRRGVTLEVLRELRLVDLDDGAMSNGTLSAIGAIESRATTQSWSRYFYDESLFQNADGLYYRGAHNAGLCVALYERARDALSPADDRLLSDAKFEGDILSTADKYGLTIFLS